MRILVDSSAWVEFLRASGHPVDLKLGQFLAAEPETVCTAAPILMEVLRGVRDDRSHEASRAWFLALPRIPTSETAFLRAADLFRALRKRGITIRSSIDCLIVAIAEEHGLSILHNDRDFSPLLALTGVGEIRAIPDAAKEPR